MRRPNTMAALVFYFELSFLISWGGIVAVVGLDGFPATPEQADTLFPAVYLAMLAGPVTAGLLMTGLVHGWAGYRDYWSRLLKWRVPARWYAALLIAPVTVTLTALALSVSSPAFTPGILASHDRMAALVFGLVIGVGAGLFEELGWTGFAIPELLKRRPVLFTGAIVGLLWGGWHFLAVFWGAPGIGGALPRSLVLPIDLFVWLPPFRMLMVWVYRHTSSTLIAVLMHASLTASALILGPTGLSGWHLITYDLALGLVFAVMAAACLARKAGTK